jgi:hypothetical protein
MISDLKSYLFDLGLAAALSVSCSSSLGELLLLSQRAAALLSASCCSFLSELLPLLLAAAPLSASCCCCSSLSELLLLLLSRRAATPLSRATTPLSANCYSSRRAAALFRSSSVSLLLSLWNVTTNYCYTNVMVLLWHKYFFENSYSSLKCSWHHCNL